MMRHGKQVIRSYMTLEFAFTGIRIQESNFTPVDWELTVNLIAPVKKGVNREESEFKASMVYQKLYFWLDANLHNTLMVDVQNEDDFYIANLSSNIAMYCPGNPGDDLIIQLIHSKLSTLADGRLVIGETHLKGSDTSLQYTYDCSEEGYALPARTSDYYVEGVARDTTPWWSRDDGFCFEFIRPTDNLTDDSVFDGIVDPMDEFERVLAEINSGTVGIIKEPAKIVKMEKWNPKKV
jgi:hypothetical protein